MNTAEHEVSLFDLLLVVAENLKLLIFGPILVGLLAWSVAWVLPLSFTSQAILALPTSTPTPTQAAAMMSSPLVLDVVVESLHLSEGRSTQAASTGLAGQVKAVVGKDGLLRVDVTAQTALQAQTIAQAVISTWLQTTRPSAQTRADLEKRLIYAQTALDAVTRLINHLADGAASLGEPLTRGEAGTSLVGLGELQARYLGEVISIPRELQGLTRDVVKQPPTRPTEPVAPKKSLIAVLAALAAGLVLLLGVFARQSWQNSAHNFAPGRVLTNM